MKENNMQRLWKKYLEKNPPDRTSTYELKICKQKSLPFSRIPPHQTSSLKNSQTGLYYKIADMAAISGFASPKPFDCMFIKAAKPYIVVWFYKPRETKIFYQIHIKSFIYMMVNAKRKSMTEEMAKEYGKAIDITSALR